MANPSATLVHTLGGSRRYRTDLVAIIASDYRPPGLPPYKIVLQETARFTLAANG
jgi:hypothetical protein